MFRALFQSSIILVIALLVMSIGKFQNILPERRWQEQKSFIALGPVCSEVAAAAVVVDDNAL